MCFSANASFGAGITLGVIGIASLAQVKKPAQIAFASIPLLFSVQQFAEGVLWLTLPVYADTTFQHIATFLFLFFAQVLWPVLVPVSIVLLERESKFKKLLIAFTVAGILASIYSFYCLISFPVKATMTCCHIVYSLDYPQTFKYPIGILYGLSAIAPLFFSNVKKMWLLGVTVVASYLISWLFYDHYLVSVWCFFASIISIGVFLLIRMLRKSTDESIDLSKGNLRINAT